MKETISNRVGRIVSGSFNSLIDAVENAAPETVMEQAIREIDGVISDVRAELGRIEANRHLAAKRLTEANKTHDDLDEKIQFAVKESRDDLAEAAIERQIDIEAQMPVLENRISTLADEKQQHEGFITALQAKKREMREELRSFRESKKATAATQTEGGASAAKNSPQGRAELATSAFDRIYEKETGMHGVGPGNAGNEAKLAELDDISHKNRIAERLAQIKAKSEG